MDRTLIKKSYMLISFLLLLNGCGVSLPISSGVNESSISGHIDGYKSNPDEKIVAVTSSTVWKFIGLAPHPPADKIDHDYSTTTNYFLEKQGERIDLYFLHQFNTYFVFNTDNQWFSFDLDDDNKYFIIYQFDFDENYVKHKIPLPVKGGLDEMYFDKFAKFIVWREVNMGYQEYNINKQEITRRYFSPSKSELDELFLVSKNRSNIAELDFFKAVESDTSPERTIDPLTIVKSDSLELLDKASRSKHYLVRWAVVLNPNTSKDMLKTLSRDNSYYVASAAYKRLKLQF